MKQASRAGILTDNIYRATQHCNKFNKTYISVDPRRGNRATSDDAILTVNETAKKNTARTRSAHQAAINHNRALAGTRYAADNLELRI